MERSPGGGSINTPVLFEPRASSESGWRRDRAGSGPTAELHRSRSRHLRDPPLSRPGSFGRPGAELLGSPHPEEGRTSASSFEKAQMGKARLQGEGIHNMYTIGYTARRRESEAPAARAWSSHRCAACLRVRRPGSLASQKMHMPKSLCKGGPVEATLVPESHKSCQGTQLPHLGLRTPMQWRAFRDQ